MSNRYYVRVGKIDTDVVRTFFQTEWNRANFERLCHMTGTLFDFDYSYTNIGDKGEGIEIVKNIKRRY